MPIPSKPTVGDPIGPVIRNTDLWNVLIDMATAWRAGDFGPGKVQSRKTVTPRGKNTSGNELAAGTVQQLNFAIMDPGSTEDAVLQLHKYTPLFSMTNPQWNADMDNLVILSQPVRDDGTAPIGRNRYVPVKIDRLVFAPRQRYAMIDPAEPTRLLTADSGKFKVLGHFPEPGGGDDVLVIIDTMESQPFWKFVPTTDGSPVDCDLYDVSDGIFDAAGTYVIPHTNADDWKAGDDPRWCVNIGNEFYEIPGPPPDLCLWICENCEQFSTPDGKCTPEAEGCCGDLEFSNGAITNGTFDIEGTVYTQTGPSVIRAPVPDDDPQLSGCAHVIPTDNGDLLATYTGNPPGTQQRWAVRVDDPPSNSLTGDGGEGTITLDGTQSQVQGSGSMDVTANQPCQRTTPADICCEPCVTAPTPRELNLHDTTVGAGGTLTHTFGGTAAIGAIFQALSISAPDPVDQVDGCTAYLGVNVTTRDQGGSGEFVSFYWDKVKAVVDNTAWYFTAPPTPVYGYDYSYSVPHASPPSCDPGVKSHPGMPSPFTQTFIDCTVYQGCPQFLWCVGDCQLSNKFPNLAGGVSFTDPLGESWQTAAAPAGISFPPYGNSVDVVMERLSDSFQEIFTVTKLGGTTWSLTSGANSGNLTCTTISNLGEQGTCGGGPVFDPTDNSIQRGNIGPLTGGAGPCPLSGGGQALSLGAMAQVSRGPGTIFRLTNPELFDKPGCQNCRDIANLMDSYYPNISRANLQRWAKSMSKTSGVDARDIVIRMRNAIVMYQGANPDEEMQGW